MENRPGTAINEARPISLKSLRAYNSAAYEMIGAITEDRSPKCFDYSVVESKSGIPSESVHRTYGTKEK